LGIVMATSELLLLSRPTCDVSGLITAPLYCTKNNKHLVFMFKLIQTDTNICPSYSSASILAVSQNNNVNASFLARFYNFILRLTSTFANLGFSKWTI
jgi:hypothetical protein